MNKTITAIYEKGVLRPLVSLHLQEQQTVQLQILLVESADQIIQKLVESHFLTPPKGYSEISKPSEKDRQNLAKRLGQANKGKLASEIIIEDRGEW